MPSSRISRLFVRVHENEIDNILLFEVELGGLFIATEHHINGQNMLRGSLQIDALCSQHFSHDTRMLRWNGQGAIWIVDFKYGCRSFLLHSSHLAHHMLSDESALCSFSAQSSLLHFSFSSLLLFAVLFLLLSQGLSHTFILSLLFQVSYINETLTFFITLFVEIGLWRLFIQKRCHTDQTIEPFFFCYIEQLIFQAWLIGISSNKIILLQFLKHFQMLHFSHRLNSALNASICYWPLNRDKYELCSTELHRATHKATGIARNRQTNGATNIARPY